MPEKNTTKFGSTSKDVEEQKTTISVGHEILEVMKILKIRTFLPSFDAVIRWMIIGLQPEEKKEVKTIIDFLGFKGILLEKEKEYTSVENKIVK